MYIELDREIKEKLEEITLTDYNFKGEMLPAENVECVIRDLLIEIDRLQEKYDDLNENSKPLTPKDMGWE